MPYTVTVSRRGLRGAAFTESYHGVATTHWRTEGNESIFYLSMADGGTVEYVARNIIRVDKTFHADA